MKKYLKYVTVAFVIVFYTSCAIMTPEILHPEKKPISNKIKSLHIGIGNSDMIRDDSNIEDYKSTYSILTGRVADIDINTIFRRHIENNICERTASKYGYIDLNVTFNDFRTNWYSIPFTIAHVFNYWMLPLVGVDTFYHKNIIEVEVTIYDSKANFLKRYIIEDKLNTNSGIVNWKSNNPNLVTAKYLSDIELMKAIMKKLSNAINRDSKYINEKLVEAGKIK